MTTLDDHRGHARTMSRTTGRPWVVFAVRRGFRTRECPAMLPLRWVAWYRDGRLMEGRSVPPPRDPVRSARVRAVRRGHRTAGPGYRRPATQEG